ncbi:MAG: hypothetical protein L0G27_10070 [Paracoccus sp. (in: a-proteobacteria)]|nr:hypothetical protein [Paracoccus sp. (in: a-proteobacteria)]
MELVGVAQEYGPPGLVILGLVAALVRLWNRINEIQDARLQDLRDSNKSHADLTREVGRSLDALADVVKARAHG